VEACTHGAISLSGDLVITDDARCVVCGDCAEVCQAEAREIVGRRVTVAEVMAEVERTLSFTTSPAVASPFLAASL